MDQCHGADYINCNSNGIIDDYTLNPSDPSLQPDLEAGTNFTTGVTSFETSNDNRIDQLHSYQNSL